ncbi:cytochrome C biosynthesis protein [Peptoniphilus raoultii]|uniref:cytochrome C biosynthesis protein n=1 Tax=Peptoniphilus raoultii TaxID=1776387 RepID=UPI0008DA5594|nr:cytochrome C biosynthesis protein [Peptoniphilus raoultii]
MSEIKELITANADYFILTIGIIILGIILTFIVNFTARDLKFLKYIPGLMLFFIGMFSIFMVTDKLFEKESLNNLIVFVIGVSSGLISLIFALIIGIASSNKNRYKRNGRR